MLPTAQPHSRIAGKGLRTRTRPFTAARPASRIAAHPNHTTTRPHLATTTTINKPCSLNPTSSTITSLNPTLLSLLAFTGASASVPAAWADATATVVDAGDTSQQGSGGLLGPLSDGLEVILKLLQSGLDAVHVPYSYGWSIIALTLMVKLVTYPFLKKQVESSMATMALKPRIDRIKARYGEDKDKVQRETTILYEEAGVDPLAGCLPTLATIPIFIGLYGSLTNVAKEGLLDAEGFYWIPSLAGPTSVAARQAGVGTAWLFPFVDGQPPIGWEDASLYLVLPVLLVAVQYLSTAIISPPIDPNDPNAKTQRAIFGFLPLMIGWFSLNVPSGLTLYYVANTVLTMGAQIYLKKLGGAKVVMKDLGPVTKLGSGRRLGALAAEEPWTFALADASAGGEGSAETAAASTEAAAEAAVKAMTSVDETSFKSKRKKMKNKPVLEA